MKTLVPYHRNPSNIMLQGEPEEGSQTKQVTSKYQTDQQLQESYEALSIAFLEESKKQIKDELQNQNEKCHLLVEKQVSEESLLVVDHITQENLQPNKFLQVLRVKILQSRGLTFLTDLHSGQASQDQVQEGQLMKFWGNILKEHFAIGLNWLAVLNAKVRTCLEIKHKIGQEIRRLLEKYWLKKMEEMKKTWISVHQAQIAQGQQVREDTKQSWMKEKQRVFQNLLTEQERLAQAFTQDLEAIPSASHELQKVTVAWQCIQQEREFMELSLEMAWRHRFNSHHGQPLADTAKNTWQVKKHCVSEMYKDLQQKIHDVKQGAVQICQRTDDRIKQENAQFLLRLWKQK